MILFALALALQVFPIEQTVTREAYLMGTRVTLAARAPQRAGAIEALDAVLASLEQTENDLSTWRETPFNRLNRLPERTPVQLDEALCGIVRELDAWTRRTDGAFDAAVGPLIDLWGVQRRARVPQGREVQAALPRSRLNAWQFDEAECTLSRPSGGRLDSGGFGKGEAIDRAVRQPAAAAWMVDLGGQVGVCACGGAPNSDGWRVGIAHPRTRDRVLFEVTLRTGSLATSGGSERDQRAHGRRVSHILDPRTGRPATFDGSVVVWHARGLVADILSTALYVMGPARGLRWAERNGIAACFLVPEGPDVRVRASTEFRRLFSLQGLSSS